MSPIKVTFGQISSIIFFLLNKRIDLLKCKLPTSPGNDSEEEEAMKKKGKKKKKITLCEGRTIEKNLANIRNTTYDLSFDVDPLIQVYWHLKC